MNRRFRSFWAAAASVGYVALGNLQSDAGLVGWLALLGLPVVLAEVWRRTTAPSPGRAEPATSRIATTRAVAWGAALWTAARLGTPGSPILDAVANLGAGTSLAACLIALSRIEETSSILKPNPAARSLDAAIFSAFLFAIATAVPATRAFSPPGVVTLDPLAIDYTTTTAGIAGLMLLVAATWRLKIMRRYELGIGDRASGALSLALTAFAVAVPAAAFDVAPPDRILPVAIVVASVCCTWAANTPEATTVSSALRGILAVTLLGVPTFLIAGLLVRSLPEERGPVVLGACLMSLLVGLIARAVARPLGPEQSRWLKAIHGATQDALLPEPDEAIRSALVQLTRAAPSPNAKPELWRNDPPEVLSVDVAGYLHVDKVDAPDRLYELAVDEPERTVRAEVLRAVQVRQPDVRALLSWFESRGAFSATVVLDEDGPLGFILLPRGNRRIPMTLEEARAVRNLADRLTALLAVSSALARSRERELAATTRADAIDDERQRLEHIIAHETEKNQVAARLFAQNLRATAHGPASRHTIEQLERIGRLNGPLTLRAELGSDPLGWAAIAHLASPRQNGPFVVVDAASASVHDLDYWTDPNSSPLSLADGGTLVVLDLAALPQAIQDHLAQVLARRAGAAPRSSVLPVSIVAVVHQPVETLVSRGLLEKQLARFMADHAVEIPPLCDRAEDMRSLFLSRLTRLGLRLKGEPMGVEPAALRLLTEHTWPGNEAELDAVLTLAAQAASGLAVSARDLGRVGFHPEVPPPPTLTPMPVPSTRRRRRTRPPPR